jgi:hypothetical protein
MATAVHLEVDSYLFYNSVVKSFRSFIVDRLSVFAMKQAEVFVLCCSDHRS